MPVMLRTLTGPCPPPQAVNFEDADGRMDGRKKYLTAKYGAHQMALIRKRLGVEMWLLDEMAKLYDTQTVSMKMVPLEITGLQSC